LYAIDDMAYPPLRTPLDIGALIRDRRRALKLDQAELAGLIGVSRLWVNQIERGKAGAGLGLVLRALDALGLTLTARPETAQGQGQGQGQGETAPPPIVTPDIDAIVAAHRRKPRL
jgi:HTH-type transcriptional regulator/antitoxin HipB